MASSRCRRRAVTDPAEAETAVSSAGKRRTAQLAWSPPDAERSDADGDPGGGAPGEPAVADPQAILERARAHAWRALNRRDRTVQELRRLLEEKGVDPAATEVVLGELLANGYLDDAGFAARFFEDRAKLDGWGVGRVERRLLELGIHPELVATTLAAQDPGAEVERALGVLRRRFAAAPADRRARDRALGVLLRKGYGYEPALTALRRHAEAPAPDHAD